MSMNKLPTKQIYLLSVIIVGIIALSVYSTYALFTFESSTSDIVTIHTPKSLKISENVYEYQQIVVEPNTITTTDVDIYNAFEYEVCYSVWYKIIGDTEIQNKVQIFEKSENNLISSGTLSTGSNIRATIVIINDNDTAVKVNLGTIGTQKQTASCSLNLASDKSVISSSYKNVEILTTKLLEEPDNIEDIEAGYLTYKDITETISFKSTDEIYMAEEFTYENEQFTLNTDELTLVEELSNKANIGNTNIYFCGDNKQCRILYKITEYTKTEETIDNEKIITYNITKYDKLIGYSKGTNGLRKINDKDYVYYGDNPNNFIYYNCLNNDDLSTCELWRIVGFFYNEETGKYNTKIVRNESIGKYQFDYRYIDDINESTNNWNDSTLQKYLNEEYKLLNNYDIYMDEYQQNVERIPNLETEIKNMKIENENINSKINLLTLSDYLYTSSCDKTKINEYTGECLTNNWLNNIEISKEWTLTSKEVEIIEEVPEEIVEENEQTENLEQTEETTQDTEIDESEENTETTTEENTEETNNYIINYVYSIGNNIEENDVNDFLDVRPTIFLKSRMVLLDGNGSLETPYIVK